MPTLTRTSTTDMEVTSIRLERELKERLKELSGNQGYQALIRDVLWTYVQQQEQGGAGREALSVADIRATVAAIARKEEHCALTGQPIPPQTPMLLGFTANGTFVPLSPDSLVEFPTPLL
jgi:predicted DNA-binding protein